MVAEKTHMLEKNHTWQKSYPKKFQRVALWSDFCRYISNPLHFLPLPSPEVTLREVYNTVNASVLPIEPKMMKNFKTRSSFTGKSPENPELLHFRNANPTDKKGRKSN